MSCITHCPECSQCVLVPADGVETAKVQCPLCDARFPLGDALKSATEGPPELIFVEPGEETSENAWAFLKETGDSPDQTTPADAESAEPESDPGESTGPSGDQAATGSIDGASVDLDEPISSLMQADPQPAALPSDAIQTTADTQIRKSPAKGMLRELIGIVISGIVGLSIAYYGLNWVKGPQMDFAGIYLPGIPHTYQHRPDWMPDWMPGAQENDTP